MRSRLVVGASGWLLGAAAATCGSMLAVSHLAHGLLGPATQQLSVADVRSDLASSHHAAGTPAASATSTPARPAARPSRTATAQPAPNGTLLVSKAGTVMASCESGLAYLQYWSPAQGYQADDVLRGPAARARLEFEGAASSLLMTVSCDGGVPADQVSTGSGDGGHHDE